jgi:hypothetical protein
MVLRRTALLDSRAPVLIFEVRPVSVMRGNSKKYNKLLKSQAIRAHLNSAKFADVSTQFGFCEAGLGVQVCWNTQ